MRAPWQATATEFEQNFPQSGRADCKNDFSNRLWLHQFNNVCDMEAVPFTYIKKTSREVFYAANNRNH